MGHLDPALTAQLITAAIGLLTGLGTLAVALAGYFRSKANSAKLDENTALTRDVKVSTDGKMDQMLSVVHGAAFAAGQKDQVDKQTVIQAAVDAAETKEQKP
jgi:hypothetical protein